MADQTNPVTGTGATNKPAVPNKGQQTAVDKNSPRSIVDEVLVKINQFQENGELRIPKDYSPENALKSAYLVLVDLKDKNDKPVLEVCKKSSIANALLKMITEGLSVAKKQCAFIAHGDSLDYQREYSGNQLLAKRVGGVKDVKARTVYQDDVFEYEVLIDGRLRLLKHEQKLANIDMNKIIGAYAVATLEDGSTDLEVMNMIQIRNAWNMGAMKGNSLAHRSFPDRMSEKSVISRLCTRYINASDDSSLYDDNAPVDLAVESSRKAIAENANKQEIDFTDAEVMPETQKVAEQAPPPQPSTTKSSTPNPTQQQIFDNNASKPAF